MKLLKYGFLNERDGRPHLLVLWGEHIVVEDGSFLAQPVDVIPH